ncbi:MAG: hypothetical protein NWE89_08260 [Candidatus Bathyarchaeota archaeon]|nr:hypothetical protein [Candidatus Bathyarchaeota archaeon]
MSGRRSTVQEAVRVIITRNPYLYRGLRMQVINYSAAARYIHTDVESLAGDQVDPNTIVTAIMRFSKEATRTRQTEPKGALHGSRLNLVTDVKDLTLNVERREQTEIMGKLLEHQRQGLYLRVHQFPGSLKIITTSDAMTQLMGDLWQYQPTVYEGFAELNIKIVQGEERYDQIALITDLLFRNGVHMVDAFYSPDEVSLIIHEEDASKAFEVIRSQIR